jgi:hypothetical protein
MIYYVFIGLTPAIFFILRVSAGLILSSLGVLWSESLTAISGLKYISESVISFVENNFTISFPRLGSIVEPNNFTHSIFTIGCYLVTGLTILTGIIVIDSFNHDIFNYIPGCRPVLNYIYIGIVDLANWISS